MLEPVDFLDATPSTNQYLSECPPAHVTGCGKAVATFVQTQGRGQRGNTWLSEPGKNIQYSLLYGPNTIPSHNQFLISQAVSLVVKTFLNEYTTGITIKWPNDIYWKNKKLGGILIEHQIKGSYVEQSIIGIGLNINQSTFPSELPDAVSLSGITGQTYDLTALTEKLHQALCKELDALTMEQEEDIQRFYVNNLYRRDGFHSYTDQNGPFDARICGIGAQGNLMLELEDGSVRTYTFKEVQYC